MTYSCHGREGMHSSHFDYRKKHITIIKAIDLTISFGHKSSFVMVNYTIWPNIYGVNSIATNKLLALYIISLLHPRVEA